MKTVREVTPHRRRGKRGRYHFVRRYLRELERRADRLQGLPSDAPDKVRLDAGIDRAYLRGTFSKEEYSALMKRLHGARGSG